MSKYTSINCNGKKIDLVYYNSRFDINFHNLHGIKVSSGKLKMKLDKSNFSAYEIAEQTALCYLVRDAWDKQTRKKNLTSIIEIKQEIISSPVNCLKLKIILDGIALYKKKK